MERFIIITIVTVIISGLLAWRHCKVFPMEDYRPQKLIIKRIPNHPSSSKAVLIGCVVGTILYLLIS